MKWKASIIAPTLITLLGALVLSAHVLLVRGASVTTSVTATASTVILTQGEYRWYENADALTPVTPLAGETTATTTPVAGTAVRLRMNVEDVSAQLDAGATFLLQYSNSTSGGWMDVGTSTAWIFFDNPAVADGQVIVATALSASDVGESYSESNPSAATPVAIAPGEKGEWDWVLKNNFATTTNRWFFRMIYSSSTALDFYDNYPEFVAATSTQTATTTSPGGGGVIGGGSGGGTGYLATTTVRLEPIDLPISDRVLRSADLNGDGRVDIVDLSILLYYYERSGSAIWRYDFDGSGEIDFPDVSIMMFYWTG
ncbi:hypothetical protein C4587_03005 [Candidatus Parcubacteria bacterium]|nr:MAG: hypothetical protein C4587_03005 [Candidatus Parcubacteria bacterium]